MYYRSFVPSWTKQQFVDMLAAKYPQTKAYFNNMSKKQLIAIYINSK